MKLRLLLCLTFFFFRAHGQEKNTTYSAFAIDNKEVVWAQVYHAQQPSDLLRDQVLDFLKRKAWIKHIHIDGGEIVADLQNFRVDYKRHGEKYMNTSNLIRTARW
ncbi:MAG: hypothetical protein WD824_25040 [Cyclobacteriaceae bacterium]